MGVDNVEEREDVRCSGPARYETSFSAVPTSAHYSVYLRLSLCMVQT